MYTEDKPELEELAHVGVLGMRWGVRRSQRSADHARAVADKADKQGRHLDAKIVRGLAKGQDKLTEAYQNRLDANIKSKKVSYESVRKQGIFNTKWKDIDPRRKQVMVMKGTMAAAMVLAAIGMTAAKRANGLG